VSTQQRPYGERAGPHFLSWKDFGVYQVRGRGGGVAFAVDKHKKQDKFNTLLGATDPQSALPLLTQPEEMFECKLFSRVLCGARRWCVMVRCCVTGVYMWYMKVYEAYARRFGGVCGVRGGRELTHTFPAIFPVQIGN
jgi:hypothetical protein